ncbi:amidohydrolase [Actinobacteria bacterium YIM 96077]|uniref:Amidohydrolase n=1 Tax=Phytoactinopolyspora halophila TaxID=1981511 RepID=A0A329QVR6_9ACTN|nr:amidohydrolase [Actinobacteria bacterium YIM 96077]RAW16514.1 amidohydrolase [Phytoactinopolyspora halophila]
MDPWRPTATSIGIWNGRIVGLDDDVSAMPAGQVHDLGGAVVIPGFVDAHTHLTWTGTASQQVDLSRCASRDAVLDAVARAVAATPQGQWVDVVGYDQRPLGEHLTWRDLEPVAAGRKVLASHISGHACLVSRAVLDMIPDGELASFDAGVVRDGDGQPTGVFLEDAMMLVRTRRLPYSVEEIVDAIEAAGRKCRAQGVTMCADAGIAAGLAGFSPVELGAYQSARERGRLPVRVQAMVPASVLRQSGADPADGVPRALDLGLRTGLGDEWLSVGALKMWLDGGMSARTAALTEPYLDGGSGRLNYTGDELAELVADAHRGGWQLAMHAIGDRAVDQAIAAVQWAQEAWPRENARHRIEHCGLVRPDQMERFAAAGLSAVVQPTFLNVFGDDYMRVMGEERSAWLYRMRSFLDRGVPLAGSSDRPVADGAPLRGIQAMVERMSSSGRPVGPDEAVSVEEALAAYTRTAAQVCGVEYLVGSVEPGKLADLVVLGEDPRRVSSSSLADIPILATLSHDREHLSTL